MLITSKVIELNDEKHNLIQNQRAEDLAISRSLNPFSKYRLNKTNRLIYELFGTIEEVSGWMYTPDYFISKSNYRYENHEIVFDVNKVSLIDGEYQPDNSSELEKQFINNFKPLLDRLITLKQKRARILAPYQKRYQAFIIDFNRALSQKKDKEGKPRELAYLKIASDEFTKTYGLDGIERLVNLLNELTTPEQIDPVQVYNNQFHGSVTNLYIDELFRWASSFTPRAQYIRDVIERKRFLAESSLTPEERELIR